MKRIARQEEMILPAPQAKRNPDRVFRRRDSRYWQARYLGADGKLICVTTRCVLECSAREWLACAKRAAARKHDLPPPDFRAADAGTSTLL